MLHSSYIEISQSALKANINFLRKQIGPDVILSSVIKGNAYGHGIEIFAPLAQSCGIHHFSVFSSDEALRLQQALLQPATTLIMGYIDIPELEWAIENGIEFYVFDQRRLEAAITISKKIGKPAVVHLELETGMNRTGIDPPELENIKKLVTENRAHVRLKGLCTHFAGAESAENHERVSRQQQLFNAQTKALSLAGIKPDLLHSACSAAMMAYPESHMDMVRIGIMQYGFWPSPEIRSRYMLSSESNRDPLQRLITWKSRIMTLKQVAAGDFIGYGNTFKAEKDMLLAIIPVGYAWGYSRWLSNQGQILIHGKHCQVTGIVNMNILMAEVTDLQGVRPNDKVVLLGTQGNETITVASFGKLSTQLNYELLTRLPLNIPRLVVD